MSGMFDTIVFDKPIKCPNCNYEIVDTQTKSFNNTLQIYEIGDKIEDFANDGVFKESYYCFNCKSFDIGDVYFVVLHGILIGIEFTNEEGIEKLRNFDYKDLLSVFNRMNEKFITEKTRYRNFISDIKCLIGLFKEESIGFLDSFYTERLKNYIKDEDDIAGVLGSMIDYHEKL